MTERASVIIVSRHRQDELRRNLPAFRFQTHRDFELILVADPGGLAVVRELGLVERIKTVAYDEPNISQARNLGLMRAAAPLVAFIDDDATPEPPWLARLLAPFKSAEIVASTGFVRGRNGISYQWKAATTDETGADRSLDVPEDEVSLHPPTLGRITKVQGTNCAFRREALMQIGGFDPAYRFYLDETDVTHRLAPGGGLTAVVPLAQVQHGYAANAMRGADRVPTDLAPIGRSAAIFLRRHLASQKHEDALNVLRAGQVARIAALGSRLGPEQAKALEESLEAGIAEGKMVPLNQLPRLKSGAESYLPYVLNEAPLRHELRACSLLGYKRALARAKADATTGDAAITLLRLSRTTRFHASWFDPSGVWIQRGGLFGRSERSDPFFRVWRRNARVERERQRIARFRSPDS